MIQDLTLLVTNMNQMNNPPQISQHSEINPKSPGNKLDIMEIEKEPKESNKRKEPQTPRPAHRKTRATANIE